MSPRSPSPRASLLAGLLALAGLACSHVTSAKEAPATKPEDAASQPEPKPAPARRARPNTTGTSAKPEAERPAAAPGRPQLANSPEGLMLPEGPALIQEALSRRGYLSKHQSRTLDAKTSEALQRFQADNGLPSTGAPDRDTVRRLGLSPAKVFRGPSD